MRAVRAFEVKRENGSVYAVGKVSCRRKPVDGGSPRRHWWNRGGEPLESVAGDFAIPRCEVLAAAGRLRVQYLPSGRQRSEYGAVSIRSIPVVYIFV